jgi:hypothetical protein
MSRELRFGEHEEMTVIDEALVRGELKKTGPIDINFFEVKSLTLAYKSNITVSCFFCASEG